MVISLLAASALAAQCAPAVAPQILLAIVRVESGFDPLAIGVNGRRHTRFHPASQAEAIATASRLIASGANIDLGLGQINSRNLQPLGLSLANAFDACSNLAAAAQILVGDYAQSDPGAGKQAALRTSLSLYNTGTKTRGFENGYVAKVAAAARMAVPSFGEASAPSPLDASTSAPTPAPPAWDVFATSAQASKGFVIQPQISGDGQ